MDLGDPRFGPYSGHGNDDGDGGGADKNVTWSKGQWLGNRNSPGPLRGFPSSFPPFSHFPHIMFLFAGMGEVSRILSLLCGLQSCPPNQGVAWG